MKFVKYAVTILVIHLLHAGLIWGLFRLRLLPEQIASLNPTFEQVWWFVVLVNIAATDVRIKDFDDQ